MKLLTVVVPCYNSAAYMHKAIESLLAGGEEMDILVINDGSKDETAAIADRFAQEYPSIVRVVHKENGGHGSGLNKGIEMGLGIYFKVVDSDDRLDKDGLMGLLDILRQHTAPEQQLDLIVHDYVYDREEKQAVFGMSYHTVMPQNKAMTWDDVKHFPLSKQFMIHSLVYRIQMLRDMGLVLPEKVFYEDNIYIYRPLPFTKRILYYHAPVYGYFIGRADQSVNDNVIIKRLDQVSFIAEEMICSYTLAELEKLPRHLRNYMINNLAGQLCTTSALQFIDGTQERGLKMNRHMWQRIKDFDIRLYKRLRRNPLGMMTVLPGKIGRKLLVWGYKTGRKLIKFG